jgi:hypothetical protein
MAIKVSYIVGQGLSLVTPVIQWGLREMWLGEVVSVVL